MNITLIALGIIFCALGIALFIVFRTDALPASLRHSALKNLTPITHAVMALALIGVGYHFLAYAMNWHHFRAPLPIAIGVATAAVVLSIINDILEKRGDKSSSD